jgi:hypothetical protein
MTGKFFERHPFGRLKINIKNKMHHREMGVMQME